MLQDGDRIGVDRSGGFGKGDRSDLVSGALRVGDIDESGVGLPGGHLVEHVGHLGFFADRVHLHTGAFVDADVSVSDGGANAAGILMDEHAQ